MIKETVSKIWKLIPRDLRRKAVRTSQTKFTVSAAAVLINDKDEVLLLDHVLRPASGWGVPGGFLDRTETPERAIRREVMEEVGLEISDLRFYKHRTFDRHLEVWFAGRPVGDATVKSREIYRLEWFSEDNIPEEMNLNQKMMVLEVFGTQV
jgi:ADP-ribose pyrophosphatase YjhB (NUDIX family)